MEKPPAVKWKVSVTVGLVIAALVAWVYVLSNGPSAQPPHSPGLALNQVKLPPGFAISVYARVPAARQMALSPAGVLYVGTRTNAAPHLLMQREGGGAVYAVSAKVKSAMQREVFTLAHGLHFPNGVAFENNSLYVAEIERVLRFDDIERHLASPPKPVVINDSFSANEWHGWKYIRFGPDGWLYVPVGMPCDVCEQSDPRFGTIMRIKKDGSQPEIFARGVRNSVGFDWDPKTHELWFTDNGRDFMGDNAPPDELNHAPVKGMNFGFPYCHGRGISDPKFGNKHSCSEFTPPAAELGPHHAALGMRFYNGTMFPEEYRGDIFIAEHGSWNSSRKVGYQIARVHMSNGKPVRYEPFATGWLGPGDNVWGRPVDVLVAPDGALLVSDDFAGVIYKISYSLDNRGKSKGN